MCLLSLISDASERLFQLCHEHGSDSPHQGNHPRRAPHLPSKPLFTSTPFYVNKSTLRGICLSSPCRVILPPCHSGGECRHVKRKLSPTSDLQFLTPPPPLLFICVSRKAVTPPLRMEELLRQLTDVSLRQHQIVEHLATRQGQADQEIAALRPATHQRVPLPDPRVQATQLLPKMTAHDDVEAYLQMFENTAITEGWNPDDWARALAPLLMGESQRAFFSLPITTAERYEDVKREILARVGLSPLCAAQYFHD